MNYSELLKDPLWLNKRKRIIYRNGNKCTVCGNKKNLHVHHTYYYNQPVEPWRYPDESLITLCRSCHEEWHKYHENEHRDKPKVIIKKKFRPQKKQKKLKKKQKHPQHKLSLAESQARRMGYYRDKFGHWVNH